MRNMSPSLLAISLLFSSPALLQAETEKEPNSVQKKTEARPVSPSVSAKFEPFTGKVAKSKVRLRLQANYEGPVLRELNRNEYVIVLGETDDFYAILPPADFKGYVFRTYVLDNVVEGDRVNVRLQPDREATIVGQLKSGERIEGIPAQANNKWFEIKLPNATRFYIAKEYVEKVGDVGFKERLDKKRNAASDLLNTTDAMSQAELVKPFDQMGITGIKANYQHLINDYAEFPDITAKAQESLTAIQDAYTAKKVAYLEEQSKHSSLTIEANKKLNAELQIQKNKINHLEQQIEQTRQVAIAVQPIKEAPYTPKKPQQLPLNMANWLPIEEALFNTWSLKSGRHNPQDFYEEQKSQGFALQGIIDAYTRPIKNKPGDYMLINSASKLPIAFLYSTHINLQDYVGHEVSILVTPRENNNFAFPAYFVLTLE